MSGCDAAVQGVHIAGTVWKVEIALAVRRASERCAVCYCAWMRRGVVALAGGLLFGCSVDSAGYGGDCVRSTECNAGLVCIEGSCTNDLSLLEDPGEVPDLSEPDTGTGPLDASAPDAAVPTLDGATPIVDAALPLPDAESPLLDAMLAPQPDAG
jgi:hypothetical protein